MKSLICLFLLSTIFGLVWSNVLIFNSNKSQGKVKFPSDGASTPSTYFEEKGENSNGSGNVKEEVFSACRDGSGGMCVGKGQCDLAHKSRNSPPSACNINEECCYGVPASTTSCRGRGGECIDAQQCGKAPVIRATRDCTEREGKVCCVYV